MHLILEQLTANFITEDWTNCISLLFPQELL